MAIKKPKQTVEECALGLLSRREHSVAELRRKLRDKGYNPGEVAECVDKLQVRGHVSDSRYAAARARYRATASKWGWYRIQLELKANGVGEEEIEAAKESLTEEGVDFDVQAENLAERMAGKSYEQKASFLRRKGYNGGQIANSLRKDGGSLGVDGEEDL